MSKESVIPQIPCPAVHLPQLRDDGERLDWLDCRRFARFRVVDWTCHEHEETWYELCEAGGVSFIRRMIGQTIKPEVAESHAWRIAEARRMWRALLAGEVR